MSAKTDSHGHHIVPLRIYLGIGEALIVLTGVTVGVSFVPLGGWNVAVALGIATIKAALVALVFMHLLYDKKIFMVIFVAAVMFVGVFIIFTMFDTLHRGDVYTGMDQPIKPAAVIYDGTSTEADSTAAGHDSSFAPGADSSTTGPAGNN